MARRCGQSGGPALAGPPPIRGDWQCVPRVRDRRRLWLGGGMPSLTRTEATARAALITVDAVERRPRPRPGGGAVRLAHDDPVHLPRPGGVDVRRPAAARPARGDPQRAAARPGIPGRRPARARPTSRPTTCSRSTPTMAYSHDGQGLHRSADPADGEHYVYGHLFLDAAPTVFACFDQPDLKAPYTVSVTRPGRLDRPRQRRAPPLVRPGAHRAGRRPCRWRPTSSRCAPGPTRPCAPSTTASRWASTRGGRSSRTCAAGRAHARGHPGVLRLLPPAVRHPVPVRGVPPGVRARSSTPARWRTPAA